MSLSPVANRSFLHGDRRQSSNSKKVVYATLDSLALKRASLPLQLVPVDGGSVVGKVSESKKKRNASSDTVAERSSFKVDSADLLSKRPVKYLLVLPSINSEGKQSRTIEEESCQTISSEIGRNANHFQIIVNDDNDNSIKTADNGSIYSSNASVYENAISSDNSCESKPYVDQSETKSLSDDYEKIEVAFPIVQAEIVEDKNVGDRETLYSDSALVKSDRPNDLIRKYASDTGLNDERYLVEALVEENTLTGGLLAGEDGKKKKHFAKHVLHFVPGYLVKRPKKIKKKKGKLNSSLSSLKPVSIDLKIETSLDSSYRSKSLFREELKYLQISSPTNFVHVASATNPSLVLNERTVGFSLEQVVITHEQKCATLPLLVARDQNSANESRGEESPMVIEKTMAPFVASISKKSNHENQRKSHAFDREDFKRELLQELQARSAKLLEQSQQVKTSETRDDTREGKTQSTDELAWTLPLPRANSSFLWSVQTRNQENSREIEEPVDEEYDDVGPLNLINQTQEDDDYDDVGLPTIPKNEYSAVEASPEDFDSIYDDVEAPSDKKNGPTSGTIVDEKSMSKDAGNVNTENRGDESGDGDSHYLFVVNEYSSVDEESDETQDDEQGVYDDVGLPSEERVNSLYAGSTTGSIFGKESEWEDLDDSTIGLPLSSITRKNNLSRTTEMQVLSSKKKSGQRRSRKIWRQRSRASRRSCKSLKKSDHDSTTIDDNTSDDTTYESLHSFQQNDFSSDSETETIDQRIDIEGKKIPSNQMIHAYLEAPTRPNPPPPREGSLTQTLGRRIKMLRRTWSITKGSLGRMRRRTSVEENRSYEESKESPNDHSNLDGGKYFNFARRHFKKSVTGLSTFYLNGHTANGSSDSTRSSDDLNQEAVYNNISRELDHYSVLADQEPLYQFYVAAAARGDFDSNSDGYEEVEETIPSRSTTDLAKPGHRTLWCQTPQVLNSSLLQNLSTEEKKIQEAKFEILTSEASYLNSLRVLEKEFLNEPLINEILSPVEKDKLFSGIPSVVHASEQFLAELETVWRHDPMLYGLPEVLLKYADKCLDIYVAYCSNQVSIDMTLKDLRSRKGLKFHETVSQIEARPTCQSLSMHSFLMLPMQRITRFPLLADAVFSKLSTEHVDRSQWERVLSSLSNVVVECNEGARAAAKEVEMESLARGSI
ncbi:ephexin isoform X2 [Calliopsis andreniformis]|uniref:ephexin isoform X2 n=1 Tax=Calliopsis andreniformis TaxID=337506 RepID=UPI003FCE2A6B